MWKKMKISAKLIACFTLIAVFSSISGIVAIVTLKNIDTNYSTALVEQGFSQGDIGKCMLMVSDDLIRTRDILSFTNAGNIADAKQKKAENLAEYLVDIEAVKAVLDTEGMRLYAQVELDMAAYDAKANELIAQRRSIDDTAESTRIQQRMIDELDPLYNQFYQSWEAVQNYMAISGHSISTELTASGNSSVLVVLAIILASIVASILIGVFIARGISTPIKRCVDRIGLLAQGNLAAEVPNIKSQDETGMLADATRTIVTALQTIIGDETMLLNEMANGNFNIKSKAVEVYIGDFTPLLGAMRNINTTLSDTLSQINQSSDQVSSGSDQVSAGAQALSQGATEQASSIEELSATITEISSQINQNAQSANEAKKQTIETGHNVEDSNRQMQMLIQAMNEINTKSSQINKIIKTIDDIAFQTNILALNAAVEAARAGAAGKGFAVVADEVRNLSGKSAEAAKSTAGLIAESIEAVNNGTKIADATAKSMMTVVDGTNNVIKLIEKIADASTEQAGAAAQVTQGVEQISSVVQTNSATAEESAAASEELSGQAQILKSLVGRFRLKHTNETHDAATMVNVMSEIQKNVEDELNNYSSKY